MPTPGELLTICHKVIPAQGAAHTVVPLPKQPERPVYSEEHKAEMRRKLAGLAEELADNMKLRNYDRLPGETEVDYGRRLWPGRERTSRWV